jgi:predicted nucleotidyltransferase
MIQNIETIKQNIVNALIPLEPEKIILFGSYAYGTPHKDSDLDIMVIKENYTDKWDEKVKIKKLLKPINLPKDILLETKDFFESHISDEWINTAWYDANRYGKVLYEKR